MFSLKTVTKNKLTHTCGSRQDSPCYLCTVKSLKPVPIKIQIGTQSIESSLLSHQGKRLSQTLLSVQETHQPHVHFHHKIVNYNNLISPHCLATSGFAFLFVCFFICVCFFKYCRPFEVSSLKYPRTSRCTCVFPLSSYILCS